MFLTIQDSNHLEACCAEFFIDGKQIGFLGEKVFLDSVIIYIREVT